MGKMFITGDIHGSAVKRFKPHMDELKQLTQDDIVFIVGDCGLPFGVNGPSYEILYKKHDKYQLDWLKQFDCTFLFLRGNHDDTDAIKMMPIVEKYGGHMRQMQFDGCLYKNIFYIDMPNVYELCGMTCLCIPGAHSHDIMYRIEHWDWWSDEKLDIDATQKVIDSHEGTEYNLILTHESPSIFLDHGLSGGPRLKPSKEENYLDFLRRSLNFKDWYHGHMHVDLDYPEVIDNRIHCLYRDIIEIKEE